MPRLLSKHVTGSLILLAIWGATAFGEADAADAIIKVKDGKAASVENAVVSLKPLFDTDMVYSAQEKPEMRQQGALFSPFVLPVQRGTTVTFPNLDEFRHHVYSFAKAKRFQLRLYGQDESKQILFDQPGVVALGCNIHDNMLAYIYVTDDPIYAKTNSEGAVRFSGLASGSYEIHVWHPDLESQDGESAETLLVQDGAADSTVTIKLRKVRKKQLSPAEGDYN